MVSDRKGISGNGYASHCGKKSVCHVKLTLLFVRNDHLFLFGGGYDVEQE